MQVVTATNLARNFRTLLDKVEFRQEELLVLRNNHAVARVIPSPAAMTAQEVLSDLYRILPEKAAKGWLADSRIDDLRNNEVSDPWES